MVNLAATTHISKLKPEELPQFKLLAKQSFPNLMDRLTFTTSEHNFALYVDGEMAGGLVLEIVTLGQKQWGLLSWIFTLPSHRGKGLARKLHRFAMDWFKDYHLEGILCFVEGDNLPSYKLFLEEGFHRSTIRDQWRRFGLNILSMWYNSGFLFAGGHQLYLKHPSLGKESKPTIPPVLTALLGLVLSLVIARRGDLGLEPFAWILSMVLGMVVFGGRILGAMLVGNIFKVKTEYRTSPALMPFAILGMILGFLVPLPGNLHLSDHEAKILDRHKVLGLMGLGSIAGLWLTWLGSLALIVHIGFEETLLPVVYHLIPLLVLDTCLPFLKSYQAQRVWTWKPWLSLVLSLGGLGLLAGQLILGQ